MDDRDERIRAVIDGSSIVITGADRAELMVHLREAVDGRMRAGRDEQAALAEVYDRILDYAADARKCRKHAPRPLMETSSRRTKLAWIVTYLSLVTLIVLHMIATPMLAEVWEGEALSAAEIALVESAVFMRMWAQVVAAILIAGGVGVAFLLLRPRK